MHRGSSKGSEVVPRGPENLPLSAPPAPQIVIEFERARAGRPEVLRVTVPCPTSLRATLRAAGLAAEGCVVLRGPTPLPLDTPLEQGERFTVVSAFSGG